MLFIILFGGSTVDMVKNISVSAVKCVNIHMECAKTRLKKASHQLRLGFATKYGLMKFCHQMSYTYFSFLRAFWILELWIRDYGSGRLITWN